jgi:aerobic-type carbon monoxide dehydrogenase small subunit (CoxS/CutS family)
VKVGFTLNGAETVVEARPDDMLVDVLGALGLASVRETCGIGVCGSCTVLVDGELGSACLLLAPLVQGRKVTTVEGLGGGHPVQRAFVEAHAFQCGYCTPAMILAASRLLEDNPRPQKEEIRLALAGNLCRCGCYVKIVDAVLLASGQDESVREERAWTS